MRKQVHSIAVGICFVLVVLLASRTFTWATPATSQERDTVPTPAPLYLPIVFKNYTPPAPLWRFGAALARHSMAEYVQMMPSQIAALRLGWYVDWGVTPNAPEPYGMEYVPIVRVKQWKLQDGSTWTTCCVGCPYVQVNGQYTYTVSPGWATLQSVAASHPGMLWVIGNEIERVDWGTSYCARQDEISPEVYAAAYHDIRQTILNADPTARFAIGGVIQATPLRLEYLNRVWNAYQQQYGEPIPVDVWNVHAFVLQEKRGDWGADIPAGLNDNEGMLYTILDNRNFAIAWEHIRALRAWMKDKDQQDKPLIITEYGVNMPPHFVGFSPQEVRDHFMYPSFHYFLNQTDINIGYPADGYRLVQRWNWYSLDDDSGKWEDGQYYQYYNGNLLYSGLGANPAGLAPLGRYWQEYVRTLPLESEPPYSQAAQSVSALSQEFAGATKSVQSNVPCEGRQIRLIFVEPALSSANLEGMGEQRQIVSEYREERICLPASVSIIGSP